MNHLEQKINNLEETLKHQRITLNQLLEIERKRSRQNVRYLKDKPEIRRPARFSRSIHTSAVVLKRAWSKFASKTTIHGFGHILNANKPLHKALWTLIILIFITLMSLVTYDSVTDYLNYDIIAQTKSYSQNESIFPAVIFCSTKQNYSLLNMITMCSFNSITCDLLTSFDAFKENNNRNCIRFNGFQNSSTEIMKTDGIGILHGLRIKFLMPEEYDSIRVFIVDNYIHSVEGSMDFYFRAPETMDFFFKKKRDKKLGWPYNDCIEMENKEAYRQQNCLGKCIHDNVLEKYDCSIPSYYSKGNFYSLQGYSF